MMLEWAYNYPNTLYDIPIPPKVIDCDNIHLGFFPVHTTSANSHTRILNYINKIQICATFNQRSRPMQFYNYLTFIIMSNCKNKLFFCKFQLSYTIYMWANYMPNSVVVSFVNCYPCSNNMNKSVFIIHKYLFIN